MPNLPDLRGGGVSRPKRSTLSLIDDGLLVVVAVVIALLLLKFVAGFVIGTFFFVLKLAALAGLVYIVGRMLLRRR